VCRTSLVLFVALTLVVSCAPLCLPACAQERTISDTQPQAQIPAKQTPPTGQAQMPVPADKQVEKIRRVVNKIAVGNKLTVYLKNGDNLHGTVSYISADNFDIAEVDFHKLLTINYADVRKVRAGYGGINLLTGRRNSAPRGVRIAFLVGSVVPIIVIIALAVTARN
jgi:hypothetical protein